MVSWTLPSPLSLVALPTPPPPALSTSLQESFLGSEALCLTWRQLSALKGEADCWQGVKTKQNLYEKDKTESFRPSGNKFCFYTWGGRAKTIIQKLCNRKEQAWDFPGGPVVENLPSNAGDSRLIPGGGTNIPRATEQLSLHTTTLHKEDTAQPKIKIINNSSLSVCAQSLSCIQLFVTPWTEAHQAPVHGISQTRILERVAVSFSGGIFLTQRLNLRLLHWQADSFPLLRQGSL